MFFIIFLSLIVLIATVFFLIKGKPNLFMFQLIDLVFGEEIEKKVGQLKNCQACLRQLRLPYLSKKTINQRR
jgi:hypothetical protein